MTSTEAISFFDQPLSGDEEEELTPPLKRKFESDGAVDNVDPPLPKHHKTDEGQPQQPQQPLKRKFVSDDAVDNVDPPLPKHHKTDDGQPQQPTKEEKMEQEAEEWWTMEKPVLELTNDMRKGVDQQGHKLWLNQLSDKALESLVVRKHEGRLSLFASPGARSQGMLLKSIIGMVRNPRVDGLGVFHQKSKTDAKRQHRWTLVPFFTPEHSAAFQVGSGKVAAFAQNLLNQLPICRELYADAWMPCWTAFVTRVAEAAFDFSDGDKDGDAIPERLSADRAASRLPDEELKAMKLAEKRQDFVNDFVLRAKQQWSPEDGRLYVKHGTFGEYSWKSWNKPKQDPQWVFEVAAEEQTGCELPVEDQTKIHAAMCKGANPTYYFDPIVYHDAQSTPIPHEAGVKPDTINLCAPPLRENDCVVFSLYASIYVQSGTTGITWRLGDRNVKIWKRGPGSVPQATFVG